MKAAVLREAKKPLEIEDVEVAKPTAREVLIRTKAAGICHSDVHFWNGSYPYPTPTVLGHESAGVVEEVGEDVKYVKPGDHVITCLSVFCGHCPFCITGRLSLCDKHETRRGYDGPQRLSKDGAPIFQFVDVSAFAEQMLVHEHAIAKIKEDMPLDRAALIGCGVTTGLGAVFHTAKVEPGTDVAVIGCGGVGLATIQGAAIAGAGRIIAVDMIGSKADLAKKLGATHFVDASEGDPVSKVRDLTNGGVDYSFEAIGLKKTAEQSFQMLDKGGTATVIGMIPIGTNVEVHGFDLLMEKRIQGSMMGSNHFRVDMPRFVEFYQQGRLNLDDMVSKRIKLEDVNDGLAELEKGADFARSVIVFD